MSSSLADFDIPLIRMFQIPEDVKIWIPDTSFINAAATYGHENSLRLFPHGTVGRKQKVSIVIPCIVTEELNETKVTLIFSVPLLL